MFTTTIRFVGGPWHNRLHDCDLAPACYVGEQAYYLAEFQTTFGTRYHQYIHVSLIKATGGQKTVAQRCYRERFKKFPMKIRSSR